jgi:uncharacterized protein
MEHLGCSLSRRYPPRHCQSFSLKLTQEFLDSGLTPESADRAGYTAIHAAASYGHLDLLRFLVKERNGDINVKDLEGDTPLHMCELVEVAQVMIEELGADVSIKNAEGLTPAEAVREGGDFDDLADYLESVTPGVEREENGVDTLAYTEFREVEGEDLPSTVDRMYERVSELMRLQEEDGINRDEEMRNVMAQTILGHIRSPRGRLDAAGTRRPRRYSQSGSESNDEEE